MSKIHDIATGLEKDVISFLNTFEFEAVDGGNNFKIINTQVDACGGFKDTLLIFECHTKTRKKDYEQATVRNKIKIFRGDLDYIKHAAKDDPTYGKYKNIVPILIIKGFQLTDEDKKFAKAYGIEIHLWPYDVIDYYLTLFKTIGKFAKYHLLGEFGIESDEAIKVIAIKNVNKGISYYTFITDPKKLLEHVYVARREIGRENYYQRTLNKNRLPTITNFLDDGEETSTGQGFFLNNIIVSMIGEYAFEPVDELSFKGEEVGILTLPKKYRSFWVIDGQHRIYAYAKSQSNSNIIVTALDNIELDEQAKIFLKINEEQKSIDNDLLWDLDGYLWPESERGIISNVVKRLDEIGPLRGKIIIPLKGKNLTQGIKIGALCDAIYKRGILKLDFSLFRDKKNYKSRIKNISHSISRFLGEIQNLSIKEEFSEFFFGNAGLSILMYLYVEIIKSSRADLNNAKKYFKSFENYLNDFGVEEVKELKARTNSEAGRRYFAGDVFEFMREDLGEVNFASEYIRETIKSKAKILEKKLRDFIHKVLSKQDKDWVHNCKGLDSNQRTRMISQSRDDFGKLPLHNYLDFGKCISIIKNNEQLINYFINTIGFHRLNELEVSLIRLKRFREEEAHAKERIKTLDEKEYARLDLKKIERCLELSEENIS